MSSREFAEWQAFSKLHPFGEERADLRAGIIAATIANAAPRKRGSRTFRPSDFMMHGDVVEKPSTPKRIAAKVSRAMGALFAMMGGPGKAEPSPGDSADDDH